MGERMPCEISEMVLTFEFVPVAEIFRSDR